MPYLLVCKTRLLLFLTFLLFKLPCTWRVCFVWRHALAGSYSNPGVLSRPTDKMVYYAGHDLNIYFIRALLGLKWLTESCVHL